MAAGHARGMKRSGALLPALALLGLSGCGDTPVAAVLRGDQAAVLRRDQAAVPRGDQAAVQASAPGVAGPTLRVSGARRHFLFTLVQASGERRLWRAEGGAALATEGPRITAIAGLGPGLAATRLDQPDPLADPAALLGHVATTRRSIDLRGAEGQAAGLRFGVALSCRLAAVAEGAWLVVTESCTGPDIAFENRFEAEAATGEVRRSRQWVGDAVLVVEAL
jgi:hypothetical protein